MKYLFKATTILLSIITFYINGIAQEGTLNKHKPFKFNKEDVFLNKEDIFHAQSLRREKISLHNKMQQKLLDNKNSKETIWVQDSIEFFDYIEDYWELIWCKKVLLRDELGNKTNSITRFWDNVEGWTNKDTIWENYYNSNTLHKYVRKPWNSSTQSWADTSHYIKYYENGLYSQYLYRHWNYSNNEFGIGFKFHYFLNNNGDYEYDIDYIWDADSLAWILSEKYNYYYDTNGYRDETLIQSWDSVADEWRNYKQRLYTYDTNGNNIQTIWHTWINDTEEWINSRNYLYTYDTNGNQTKEFRQNWDSNIEEWVNSKQYISTYDNNGNLIQRLAQEWKIEIEDWENSSQHLYNYDAKGNLTQHLVQHWNRNIENWENLYQNLYIYDNNENQTQQLQQNWDISIEEWVNSFKYNYYWSEFEISGIESVNYHEVSVFPNPATDKLRISSEISLKKAIVNIFSISGKLIYNSTLADNSIININDLPAGVYIIKINSESINFVDKIIKN